MDIVPTSFLGNEEAKILTLRSLRLGELMADGQKPETTNLLALVPPLNPALKSFIELFGIYFIVLGIRLL
jgi:hypothetical protein